MWIAKHSASFLLMYDCETRSVDHCLWWHEFMRESFAREGRTFWDLICFWIVASTLSLNQRRKAINSRLLVHCEYTNAFHIVFHSWQRRCALCSLCSRSGRIQLFNASVLSQRGSSKYFRFPCCCFWRIREDLSHKLERFFVMFV